MKTVNLHVGELLSPLGALGVERQLAKLAGVRAAAVNTVSGCATVTYDDQQIDMSVIEQAIERCGHHCGGALDPKHLCEGRKPARQEFALGKKHEDHTHGDHDMQRESRQTQHRHAPANDFERKRPTDHGGGHGEAIGIAAGMCGRRRAGERERCEREACNDVRGGLGLGCTRHVTPPKRRRRTARH